MSAPIRTFTPEEAAELRERLDAIAGKGPLPAWLLAAALDGLLAGAELAAAVLANAEAPDTEQ